MKRIQPRACVTVNAAYKFSSACQANNKGVASESVARRHILPAGCIPGRGNSGFQPAGACARVGEGMIVGAHCLWIVCYQNEGVGVVTHWTCIHLFLDHVYKRIDFSSVPEIHCFDTWFLFFLV